MPKRKSRCKFCNNYDFPVIVKLPEKRIEVYCSQCGELIEKYRLKKKQDGFYRKIVEY